MQLRPLVTPGACCVMSHLRVGDTSKRMVKICSPRPCRNMDVASAKKWLMHTHGQLQLLLAHVYTVATHTRTRNPRT